MPINTLASGDFFSEIALISQGPRTATDTTTTPSRVLVLTERAFARVLREMPSVEVNQLRAAARRLQPEAI